jgi:hypothetical protein
MNDTMKIIVMATLTAAFAPALADDAPSAQPVKT